MAAPTCDTRSAVEADPQAPRRGLSWLWGGLWGWLLAGLVTGQGLSAVDATSVAGVEWMVPLLERDSAGFYRERFTWQLPREHEFVVWVDPGSGDASVRAMLGSAAALEPPVAKAASSLAGAVVVVALEPHGEPEDRELVLEVERETPGELRVRVHMPALSAARSRELGQIEAAIETERGAERVERTEQLEGLLARLRSAPLVGWRDGMLANRLGGEFGRVGADAQAAQAFELCVQALTPWLSQRSAVLLDARLDSARARARSGAAGQVVAELDQLRHQVVSIHGSGDARMLQLEQEVAHAQRRAGQLLEARKGFFEALARGREELREDHPERVRLLHNAAAISFELKDYWRSLELEREALEFLDLYGIENRRFRRAVALQMALTTRLLGVVDGGGIEELDRVAALVAREVGGDHPDVLRLRSNLALDWVKEGCTERALELAREVHRVRSEQLGPAHVETLIAQERLATVLRAGGFTRDALQLARDVRRRREHELPAWSDDLLVSHEFIGACLLELGEGAQAVAEAQSLEHGLEGALAAAARLTWRERLERVAQLRRNLGALVRLRELTQGVVETRAAAAGHLGSAAARAAKGRSFALLAWAHAMAGRGPERPPILARRRSLFETLAPHALGRLLPAGTALLAGFEFDRVELRPTLGLRVGRRGSFRLTAITSTGRFLEHTAEIAALDSAVSEWRAAMGEPLIDGRPRPGAVVAAGPRARAEHERAAGSRLLRVAFGDILDELGPSVRRLVFCGEGALGLVPLDALPWADGRLGDRYQLALVASLADLARAPAKQAEPHFVAVGGVATVRAGGVRRYALPGSAQEARAAAQLFEERLGATHELLLGEAARPALVEAALGRASHALFATHGYVERDAPPVASELPDEREIATALAPFSRCGLALSAPLAGVTGLDSGGAGGWSGERIAALDLSGLSLVVLSACDTRDGYARSGQGLFSLQRAFHTAGARMSLASLWRVKNDYASLITSAFLKLLMGGAPASDALWQAKCSLRDELGLEPRFWAGWVLVGDGLE